jgi:hypothetical protein
MATYIIDLTRPYQAAQPMVNVRSLAESTRVSPAKQRHYKVQYGFPPCALFLKGVCTHLAKRSSRLFTTTTSCNSPRRLSGQIRSLVANRTNHKIKEPVTLSAKHFASATYRAAGVTSRPLSESSAFCARASSALA